MLSTIPSLSRQSVETFLRDQFIPKHDELFCRTPYELALEQASVSVQTVDEFRLYQWGSGNEHGQINIQWRGLRNRIFHCKRQLESSLDGPSPFLCNSPELSVFAKLRQPLLMDSSEGCSSMQHVYPFTSTGDSLALTTIPSMASIVALLVGKDSLDTLMKGQEMLSHMESCIHEVTNPMLNISTVVVDVDLEAGSKIVSKVRESQTYLEQFCSELIQNVRRVLEHLETKCSRLIGLADAVKHLVFRTQPGDRSKEGFHHLIVLPDWVCLQNIRVASAFVQLMQITRHCMPMTGEQGVTFDNIYESCRHPMRLPFQCKSKGNHPLLLIHSDYGDAWDVSLNVGSLFMHGNKHPHALHVGENMGMQPERVLVDDISGLNAMSEGTEHHRHAISVLSQRNRIETQQSSWPSVFERFGEDLNCSSLTEMGTLLEKAFTRYDCTTSA